MFRFACILSYALSAAQAAGPAVDPRVLTAPLQFSSGNASRVLVGNRPSNGPAPTAAR